jgi:hypothetical protein
MNTETLKSVAKTVNTLGAHYTDKELVAVFTALSSEILSEGLADISRQLDRIATAIEKRADDAMR